MKYVSGLLNAVIAAIIISVSINSFGIAQQTGTVESKLKFSQQEFDCMAMNIYWEARNQSKAGMIAVGQVTLNRMYDSRYPNSICEVVKQGPVKESWKTRGKDVPDAERKYVPVRHMCQFSWYCDGKKDDIPSNDLTAWKQSNEVAYALLYEGLTDITEGATHYHAHYVSPSWRKQLHYVARIDDHLFYQWN